MAKRPDRRPSAEELDLFRRTMADATPLRKDDDGSSDDPGSRTAPPPPARPAAAPRIPPPGRPPPGLAPLSPGVAADLDRRTMDRLRKGRLRPEARLDLHGMTADAAHGALAGFLGSAQAAGKRCVLVITGKGSLKEGGGVLRRELPAWLNSAANRNRVLGFAQAQPGDGGTGAFYVLLRRRRG